MTSVGIAEVMDMLPDLIRAAEGGEQVLITRDGVPVARIVPPALKSKVILGGMRDRVRLLPGWDDPTTEEELLGSRLKD